MAKIKNKKQKIILIISAAAVLVLLLAFLLSVSLPKFTVECSENKNIQIEVGTNFLDKGADAYIGKRKLKSKIYSKDKIDTQKIGEYELTYKAKFLWRKAEKTVNIIVKDTQAPIILLNQTGVLTKPGEEYEEEGFSAIDNYDGDISAKVKRHAEGKTVCYSVTDSSGNVTEVTRNIKYIDLKGPKITLFGDSVVKISMGERFEDPGFTAIDDVDGDLSKEVKTRSNIDASKLGEYEVVYRVKDKAGNESQVKRKVLVEKKNPNQQKPQILNGKVIYLTFDDGPSKHTPRLLNILKKYNVRATFFVVGMGNLNYLDDIVNDGHSIGLHTMTHNYAKVYSNEKAFMDEIETLRRIVYNKTGVDTTMIRFPGGSSNTISKRYNRGIMTRLTKEVTKQGYQYYDWNVSSGDAGEVSTSRQVYNNVINGVRNQKMSIVLQHDSKGFSVDAVEDIIKWGLSNGYTFKKLTPDSPTVHHPILN